MAEASGPRNADSVIENSRASYRHPLTTSTFLNAPSNPCIRHYSSAPISQRSFLISLFLHAMKLNCERRDLLFFATI